MMTGADFLDRIVELADKSTQDAVYRAKALNWLRLVVKDLQARQDTWHWRWLEKTATFNTVDSQHTYDLPTDMDTHKVFSITDRTDDVTLKYMNYDRFTRLVADPSEDEGLPSTIYTLWSDYLKLYPIPDDIRTLYMDYVRVITEPADNTTEIDVPDKYTPVLIDGVMVYVFRYDPTLGDFMGQAQIYEMGVNRMLTENKLVLGDYSRTESHREKWARSNEIQGKNSACFPLGNESM